MPLEGLAACSQPRACSGTRKGSRNHPFHTKDFCRSVDVLVGKIDGNGQQYQGGDGFRQGLFDFILAWFRSMMVESLKTSGTVEGNIIGPPI